MNTIYTIGHSNHKWEAFAALLKQHDIELLVDARTNPISRYAPFANRRTLPDLLDDIGIAYNFMGDSLGGKPADPALYDPKGKPDYRRMRARGEFREGISRLAGMTSRRRIAVMCSEEDPSQCHRLLLLGPPLEEAGCELRHIRRDGSVSSTDALGGKKYGQQLQGTFPM